jgi:hypothetical protein
MDSAERSLAGMVAWLQARKANQPLGSYCKSGFPIDTSADNCKSLSRPLFVAA